MKEEEEKCGTDCSCHGAKPKLRITIIADDGEKWVNHFKPINMVWECDLCGCKWQLTLDEGPVGDGKETLVIEVG